MNAAIRMPTNASNTEPVCSGNLSFRLFFRIWWIDGARSAAAYSPNSPCLAKSTHKKGARCSRSRKNAPQMGMKLPTTLEKAHRPANRQCAQAESRTALMIDIFLRPRSKESKMSLMIRKDHPHKFHIGGPQKYNIHPFRGLAEPNLTIPQNADNQYGSARFRQQSRWTHYRRVAR